METSRPPDHALLAELRAALPPGALLDAEADLARYSHDWSGDHHGRPLAVARLARTAEVATILRHCRRHRVPVVPQGGLTGLVGAAVPEDGRELVVSLERMGAVRAVSPIDFTMVVEAGCVLEDAKRAAEAEGCILPVSFGAQGSCRIGGIVATNAGGFNVLRYGMTRDLVLGLEVVLADGRVWNGLRRLRKDNRGYDLKQLFVGSEGTLGIVTAAALKLSPKPEQVQTALVGLRSVEDAVALYAHVRRSSSDLVTAFELLLRGCLDVSLRDDPALADPLASVHPVYALIELSCGAGIALGELMENALASAGGLIEDGVIAASQAQAQRLWRLRETMVETQGGGAPYLRTDVSLPVSLIPAFLAEVMPLLEDRFAGSRALAYGHVGDGNIHLNLVPPSGLATPARDALLHEAEAAIFDVLDHYHGSISAEHGIGRLKQAAFLSRIDPVSLSLARGIKRLLDPDEMLSPGRILPASRAPAGSAGGPTCRSREPTL